MLYIESICILHKIPTCKLHALRVAFSSINIYFLLKWSSSVAKLSWLKFNKY